MTSISLFNPGFESGIHTDARSICTAGNMNAITVETSAAHTGTYGMKWNPALASGYGTLTIKPKTVGQSTTYIPSARGTYTFSFWAKTNAVQGAHTVTLRFQFYDANNTLLDEVAENAAQSVPITTQWQQFTIDVDQPVNGTTYVQPIVDIALTEDLNNASFYFDDLSLDFVSIPLPVLPKRTNLIKNPSFQSSTFGWTVREATIARDTTQHYLGDACLRMNAISGGTQSSLTMNRAIPVVAGADYTLSAYIKIPSNLSIPYRVMIEWYSGPNNDGTYLGETVSAMFQNTTDWTRRFVTGRAPAGAQSAIAYVIGTALTTASTDVLYIDAVLMETGDLQEYFDGDTPGYTWDGVPYESTSSTKAVFPVVPQGPDYLRLEVEHPTEGLQNLINNPSGAKGAWGWQTPKETTNLLAVDDGSGGPALKFVTNIQQTANLKTEFIGCTPGTYMAAQMTILGRTGITSNVRARFDFYDVNKAYVSSSAFTAYFEQLGTFYTPPALVPAGAAYVQWRVDMGNSAFTDTQARAGQYFTYNKAMLTSTLTTGALGTLRRNLVPNPSFTSALTGWEGAYGSLTRVTTGGFTGAANARYQQVPNGASHLYRVSNYNKPIAITGGRDYTFSAYIKVTAAMTVRYKLMIEWYDDNMNWMGSKEEADPNKMWYAVQPWTRYSLTATAPSKATKAVLYFVANTDGSKSTLNAFYIDGVLFEEGNVLKGYFDGDTTDTATINYGWTGTANNSISTSTTTGDAWDYEDPNDWRNILGPTHEISITRNALDVGTLSAEILDADLDPAVATWVTPGKRVRMLSLVGDDWESLFEGRLTNANVTYVGGVRIQVTASDSISHLANQGEARGVNTIDELPYILEGRGVPWNVNGSGNQVSTATVVSLNDNASVLDQVAICRDSNLGYAWVDREDVLQAWDASKMATGNVYTFSDQASNDATWLSYSDIDVNFNTEVCINDVTITYLRYDVQAGQTEEVIYGPYRNEDSVRTWGAMSANFTIQSQVESPSAIAAYAQSVLAANGVPVIRANGLSTPVRNDKERKAVTLLDLYSPVAVKYDNKVDNTYRITGITHTITPKLWTVDYTFDVQDSVAAPQVTPSPSKSGVGDVTPFNAINVKSGRDANTSAGNTPALMVGPRTGTHLRVDGNEILAMTSDNTQGSLYLNQGGTTAIGTAQVTQLNARGNIQSGTLTSAALANGATVSISVTFSTPFNSVPSVVGSTSSYRYTVGATSITKTGFNLMVANYSGAAGAGISATWIAVGM